MIRNCTTKDLTSIAIYFSQKLNISLFEANIKAKKIIKSGLPSLIKESKDLVGIAWIESRIVNDKKEKYIEILVNNWRLAEDFIQSFRWQLNGIYWFSLPRHDFLNRTLNKAGIRFVKVDGDKNIYNYKFERRQFFNYKSEDND